MAAAIDEARFKRLVRGLVEEAAAAREQAMRVAALRLMPARWWRLSSACTSLAAQPALVTARLRCVGGLPQSSNLFHWMRAMLAGDSVSASIN